MGRASDEKKKKEEKKKSKKEGLPLPSQGGWNRSSRKNDFFSPFVANWRCTSIVHIW